MRFCIFLMTPCFDLRGIVAAHFEAKYPTGDPFSGTSMQQSYDEVLRLFELADVEDVPLYRGAEGPMERLKNRESGSLICCRM